MNLGCIIQLTEFKHFNDGLPVGHKIVGERAALHPLCTELLVEGPDMPIWKEGQKVEYVAVKVISEVQQGDCMHLTLTWYHNQKEVWNQIVSMDDYARWVIIGNKISPEVDAAYKDVWI